MLHRLLLLGVALAIMIVATTGPREKRPMVIALGIVLFVFSAHAIDRADSGWVLVDVLGAAAAGWIFRDVVGGRRSADAGISRQ